ncbi:MAG: PAS domain S-box protein, partial [Chloroflexota bacterium]
RQKNGNRLWAIVSATAITDAEGRFDGAFGMITDITDRKQAEEALRDGEERYHSLFDQSIVVVSAKDGKWIQISPLFCDMLGYSMEELMGMIFTQITHPDDLAANLEQIKRIVKGEIDNFILEKRYLHKNGDVVWANISVTSIRDTFGALVQTVAVIQNITERKQYEMALVESQTMTKAIVDSTSDMIWSVDPDNYGLQTFNHGLRDYFLHKRGISIQKGMRPEDLFPTEDFVKLWREFYQRALKEGPYSMDYIAYTGSVMMQLTFNLLKCDGKVFGISVFGKDITERRRAEEEKEKLSEQLFQAQKMESIGRLAGGVAHDFNNMLGVIMGHSEMAIAKTSPNQSIYPDLQEILKATQSSADLTRQLLAFARKQIAIPKILDLNDTVGNMLKMLRRLIGENIDLVWHPGDDLWNVKVDPTHIDQILANLLVNARDAIAGDGKITIETTNIGFDEADCAQYAELTPGKYVLLSVSDNGSGMNHETLSHIFEPFYTTKDVGKGTGLGLATVYGIVKQNNGYINVYSEPGQGTTFKIYLPRSESKAIPITVSEKEENTPRGMETVLMVEDEESLLELGKDTLEAQGYTVLVASTPEKALNIIQEHASGDVHLLITDVVMPGMNGRKLAEHVKAICPDMKCLFMSGYTSDIIADQGVLDEDVYFIQKPFPLNDLAVKVHQVLTQ